MNIAKTSVNHPTFVVVLFTALIFLGIYSYTNLNYELMPKFSSPVFTVATVYPGASPSIVENSVTKKIEDGLSTIENLDCTRSISQEGISIVAVTLKMSADIDYSLQEAQRKLNIIKNDLPKEALDPMITKFSMSDLPIMSIGAVSTINPTEFYDLLKYRVKPVLQQVKGVGDITLTGGSEREIRVNLNSEQMEAYGISALDILRAVKTADLDFPTGKIKNNNNQMVIRLSAKFKNLDDIRNIIISYNEKGSPVKLKDVAEVNDAEKEFSSLARVNGISSVGLILKKQSDANTVEVSHLVKKELRKLETEFAGKNIKFSIPTDASVFTEEAADSVMKDLLFAIILVSLVMLAFLHSLRNAFIVMLAVPISLIVSFLGMYIMGYTLNMMTLLALSLVIGILVDDAVVVLENIYRHLEMGKDKVTATLDGRMEISFTAVAITMVDVVVFLPIGLSKSIISPMLGPYALVIVITTLLSLLVAFTAVPLLTSRLAKLMIPDKRIITGKFTIWFERQIDNFADILHHILVWAFRHKILTFIIVTLLLVVSIALIPAGFVGSELFGIGDASEFIIQVELTKDATLKETNQKVLEIEKILYGKPEVRTVFTQVGSSSSGFLGSQSNSYKAEINVKLIPKEYRNVSSVVYSNRIKNELNSMFPGVKVTTAVVNPFMGGTDDNPIQVVVKSAIPDSLEKYAAIIKKLIESVPGTNEVRSSIESATSEVSVEINKERMADLGLTLEGVGMVMQTAFSGNTDAKYKDGQYEYDINIIYDEFDRQNIDDVSNLVFINSSGEQIKLSQFANITISTGSTKLERYDRISSAMIESIALGRSTGDIGEEIKQKIAAMSFPEEISIVYESEMKYQDEAFGSLGFALLASIFLVYLIMVALYESYLYPFVVLFSIPLAIVGAILALALTRSNLSIFSLLGLVMLVGLVAKNAIIVVDFTNNLSRKGYRTTRALLMATRIRLRPVLMTTMSMVIGLLPIAMASGPASEWKNGLAWVLIGGLLSSMLLTLVVIPLVYLIMDTLKGKLITWLHKKRKQSLERV
jgi:hydrophobic/amphiphilic exporter-1 (mainly G- bacteria), HAE1 family